MKTYVHKPTEVRAIRYEPMGESHVGIFQIAEALKGYGPFHIGYKHAACEDLEIGFEKSDITLILKPGEWLIDGIHCIYTCPHETFLASYEEKK